jgi:membrane protease YdiL (CAAX protease family)
VGNAFAPDKRNTGKAVLAIIIAFAVLATILFWVAIKQFQLQGLPLYFSQLGLYLFFYLLAWWGMKQEQISLPVTKRLIVEALAWSLVSWVVFVLLIQLFGLAQLSEEFLALQKIPAWKIGMQMLSTWLFVGLGEEVLFRGYFLKAFWRHFTIESDRRRMVKAALLSSAFFSLWHLPVRIAQVISGELDWVTLLVSLLMLFLLGLGFTYLFIRSDNIILTGLVHGLVDYPLVGKNTQLSFIILLVAIGCVEIARLAARKKFETSYRIPEPGAQKN